MGAIPVVALSAFSGTGKTTLGVKLVSELLKRGLSAAVIKHDVHGISENDEDKDSRKYLDAGASRVILAAPGTPEGNKDIYSLIDSVSGVDIIIVEGWKNARLPRIGLDRKQNGKGFTSENFSDYIALACDYAIKDTEKPVFSLDDYKGLTDYIMDNMGKFTDFTHFDDNGKARMVNVGEKPETDRSAVAGGRVKLNRNTYELIKSGGVKKGDVLTVAQIAGIMGAKRTSDIIPMCHPLLINGVNLKLTLNEELCCVDVEAEIKTFGKTGAEMEALTAVSVAALTVYDMCKAVQRDMELTDIRLLKKSGGMSGDYERKE